MSAVVELSPVVLAATGWTWEHLRGLVAEAGSSREASREIELLGIRDVQVRTRLHLAARVELAVAAGVPLALRVVLTAASGYERAYEAVYAPASGQPARMSVTDYPEGLS